MKNIIISSITGLTPPYEIYICNFLGNDCVYIDTITNSVPPIEVIPLPDAFSGAPAVTLKINEVLVPCVKEIPVVCTLLPGVYATFCNCADTSVCLYTENVPILNFGDVVSLENFGQCWTFSGFQFTNDVAIDLLVTGSTFSTCQDCYNFVAPTYFSACCSNYTFTFEDSFQSTFEPEISWYVEIPPSGTGTGTGYTGCTIVIGNYETPNQTYLSTSDWNSSTNRDYSIVLPNPIMRNCNDCEEINPC